MRPMRPACLLFLITAAIPLQSQSGLEELSIEEVYSGLENPVWVAAEPGGLLTVTLLPGVVLRSMGESFEPASVLDLQDRVRGGGGLNSVAFHPSMPWIFAHFSEAGSGDFVLSRFELSGDPPRAQRASEVELLRLPKAFPLHYGGQLAFGPDGYLWVSTGDGSNPGNPDPTCSAQNTASLEGKILRLDVDSQPMTAPYYSIPADNPFASAGGAPEVWGSGLRNPWRFSFDREQSVLWVSDVGEDQREEVTRIDPATAGGTNFGWKRMEGTRCFPNVAGCGSDLPACGDAAYEPPTVEYLNAGGRCAVIGGFVYRGRLIPGLYGRYVYGDFCSGDLWAATESGVVEALPLELRGINSFGQDAAGELWMTAGDKVFTLRNNGLPTAGLIEFETTSLEVAESSGTAAVSLLRVGGSEGSVEATVTALGITATVGEDFVAMPTTVTWQDGEQGMKTFPLALIDDAVAEPLESLQLSSEVTGGDAVAGARSTAAVSITDDDPCTADGAHLCLGNGRFSASVSWRTAEGLEGVGNPVSLGEDSGSFWFFSDNNPEIFLKVLDACNVAGLEGHWVFAAGLTDVQTTLRVFDTLSGQTREYNRALGESYTPVRDTGAFPFCP
jgi:glucose/arabinose dehydrogenase